MTHCSEGAALWRVGVPGALHLGGLSATESVGGRWEKKVERSEKIYSFKFFTDCLLHTSYRVNEYRMNE